MTDLIERIKWITDAVSGQDLGVNALTSYMIRDGFIHASDGRMVVGTPFPFEGEVLVPAAEFERVLVNKPEGEFTWEFEPDRLVLKRGRFKGRIKTLPIENWVYPLDAKGDMDIPEGFVESLKALLPFCSENATQPWATTIGLIDDYMYATNNIVVARVFLGQDWHENLCREEDAEPPQHLVPRWVAEFICKREEGLKAWSIDDTSITFTWADGSWMRSQLILSKFAPVRDVFAKLYEGQFLDVEIKPEWRRTLLRVGKITGDPVLRLRVDEVRGSSGEVLSVEDDAGTPCPEGVEETVWDLRYLEEMIKVATHWNPRTWPSPAPWKGEYLEGVIAGRRD